MSERPVSLGETPKPAVSMGETPKPAVSLGETLTPPARPAHHAVLPAGSLVGGRYRVEGVIGEGSQSVVYLARLAEAQSPGKEAPEVALKVIHRHLCGDPQISRRFAREASILRRLEGEHVARLLDFVEDDGLVAIALERVQGRSLEALLAERAPLDLDVAVEISLQVCAALGAAHANGIVHRDLKTANVLVEGGSGASGAIRIKVVDFGLSKVLQGETGTALTEQGMIFGTPEYMAPEQARGDDVDARADIYAAGIMLYEMAVGAPPFSGRSALGTMSAHLSEAPRSPRAVRPESSITPALEKVILRALAKSPEDRFASARELAQAISAARAEPLVIAPPGVSNPDEIATSDTDLHLVPPSFAEARTLRPEQVAAVQALDHAARVPAPEPSPLPPAPRPGAASDLADTLESPRLARVEAAPILDEPTAPPGEMPRRGGLVWVIVAVVAAAVGVIIGVMVGTR